MPLNSDDRMFLIQVLTALPDCADARKLLEDEVAYVKSEVKAKAEIRNAERREGQRMADAVMRGVR